MAKKNTNYKKNRKNKNKKVNETEEAIKNEKTIEEFVDRIKDSKKCMKSREYLEMFEKNKDSWKFNKMLQVFILNFICIKDIFSKESFHIFKGYLKKMNDKTKKEFIDKCTKNVQSYQEGNLKIISNSVLTFKDKEKGDKINEVFHKRCVDLIENSGA